MNSNEKRILAHLIQLAHAHGYTVHSVYDGEEHQKVPDNVGVNPLGIGLGPAFAREDESKPDRYLQRVVEWATEELDALDEGHLWFNVPDSAPPNEAGINPGYRPKSKKLWVYFIWGNGNAGCDCITDYVAFTHFDQNVIDPAYKLSERLAEGKVTFADVLVGEKFLNTCGDCFQRVDLGGDGHNAYNVETCHRVFFPGTDPVGVAPV